MLFRSVSQSRYQQQVNEAQQAIAYRITRNPDVLDKYNVVAIIGVDEKGDELVGFEVLTQVEFEDDE